MTTPKVLCIKDLNCIANLGSIEEIIMQKIRIKNGKSINIKANKLYYLFIAKHPGLLTDGTVADFKIYHITSFRIEDSDMILSLGSSTVLNRIPEIKGQFDYKDLSEFGLQELQPGCLLRIVGGSYAE